MIAMPLRGGTGFNIGKQRRVHGRAVVPFSQDGSLLAQNVGHIVCHLLVPPVPVVVDIVTPQVYPDGDMLCLKDALEQPCGVRLFPVALTAADNGLLAAEQLHWQEFNGKKYSLFLEYAITTFGCWQSIPRISWK